MGRNKMKYGEREREREREREKLTLTTGHQHETPKQPTRRNEETNPIVSG